MSKYMHTSITVLPYYPRNLEETYPKLARSLKSLESGLVERNTSLYEIAGQLDKLLYTFDGTPLREVLLRHGENLRTLHKSTEEQIAGTSRLYGYPASPSPGPQRGIEEISGTKRPQ